VKIPRGLTKGPLLPLILRKTWPTPVHSEGECTWELDFRGLGQVYFNSFLCRAPNSQTFHPRTTHWGQLWQAKACFGLNGAHLMACKYTLLSRPCHYSYRFILTRATCRNILSILYQNRISPPGRAKKKGSPPKN
jgi:hypothetical protein